MKHPILFCFALLNILIVFPIRPTVNADDRLERFYERTLPSVERYCQRLKKDGPSHLSVPTLFDNAYILGMSRNDLPKEKRPSLESLSLLFNVGEEMQNKDSKSPTYGNFRWYWKNKGVTDRNAVEFVVTHALPIWLKARDHLTPDAENRLEKILRLSIEGCLRHHVRPDYTNIALHNAVNLILLGETFDRPDVIAEGEKRLQAVIYAIGDHGISEYNSSNYYAVSLNALQLGFRHIQNDKIRSGVKVLLDYFWTDLALNWYLPSLRLAGAQSRTYDYVYGSEGLNRIMESVGLAPENPIGTSADCLESFYAAYIPDSTILKLNDIYPRLVSRRWGNAPGQWARSYILPDIALGTTGAAYRHSRHDMPLTVDLADYDDVPETLPKYLPRSYFIADGRNDPYCMNRHATPGAGHRKALHLDAFWLGTQRTVDSLGIVLYTPSSLKDSELTNVQSHFVFRKPESIYLDEKIVTLSSVPLEVGDKPVFFRYGKRAFAVRIPWTRNKEGKSPKAYLIDDGNKLGVGRLTIDHWPKETKVSGNGLEPMPGAAFWVRIGSEFNDEETFIRWCRSFTTAKIDKLHIEGDDIAIQIAGFDGPLSVSGMGLSKKRSQIVLEPTVPNGILELNGKDLGRPILDQYSNLSEHIQQLENKKPITINPKGYYWEAEKGTSRSSTLVEPCNDASSKHIVRIYDEISWQLDVPVKDIYYLWARVFAPDRDHDSIFIDMFKESKMRNHVPMEFGRVWHTGNGPHWRWIPLILDDGKVPVQLKLDSDLWWMTIRPREPDVLIDRFFLTKDPYARPQE